GTLAIAIAGLKDAKDSGSTCQSISYWLMIGGAAALVGGDLTVNIVHDSKMSGIRKSWGEILTGEQEAKGDKDTPKIAGIDAQSAAFGKLAELEDRMAKTAKAKRILFDVAGGAFAASAVAAGLELIAQKMPNSTVSYICAQGDNKEKIRKQRIINKELDKPIDASLHKGRGAFVFPTNTEKKQITYNLSQSKSLSELIINHQASSQFLQSPSIDEYEEIKEAYSALHLDKDQFELLKSVMMTVMSNLNPLPSSFAKQESNSKKVYDYYEKKQVNASAYTLGSVALVGVLGGTLNVSKNFLEKQKSWMTTPEARASFSGVISTLSFVMAGQLKKSQKTAEARAAHLRQVEQSMLNSKDAMNICKSEDRNNQ